MQLDLPTLLVMQSFALACAGTALLAAWSQNRIIKALALWGIAHIFAAGGFVSLMLGWVLRQPGWVLGVTLLVLQASLVWKAARPIDSKPGPIVVVILGPAVVGIVGVVFGVQYAPASSLALAAERLMDSPHDGHAWRLPLLRFTATAFSVPWLLGSRRCPDRFCRQCCSWGLAMRYSCSHWR